MASLIKFALLALAYASSQVTSQSTLVCDVNRLNCFQEVSLPDRSLVVGLALPPILQESPNRTTEFIGKFVFSLKGYGYGAVSLDGAFRTAFFGWIPPVNTTNPGDRILSPRILDGASPEPFSGPNITVINGTMGNATHATTVFRCINCLGIPLVNPDLASADAPIGLIRSSERPVPNGDVNATIPFDKSFIVGSTLNFAGARFSDYFDRF